MNKPTAKPRTKPEGQAKETPLARVNRFIAKAQTEGYISEAMANLFRKEAAEHSTEAEHLSGMCTRIVSAVEAEKKRLTDTANKGFENPPAPPVDDDEPSKTSKGENNG